MYEFLYGTYLGWFINLLLSKEGQYVASLGVLGYHPLSGDCNNVDEAKGNPAIILIIGFSRFHFLEMSQGDQRTGWHS